MIEHNAVCGEGYPSLALETSVGKQEKVFMITKNQKYSA
jgi:hypothetical protein